MKQKLFNRTIILRLAGTMFFSFAACGDSKEKDEEIAQETAQESEYEIIEPAESEDNTENNDIDTVRDSSSDGITEMDLMILNLGFQPGDESESGSESQSGQAANPNAEAQPGEAAKPGTEPQSGAVPQPGEETKSSAVPQSDAGTQTAHVHSFQGGNCSAPATCSCGGSTSIWTDEQGEKHVETGCNFSTTDRAAFDSHQQSSSHSGSISMGGAYQDIYEDRDIVENVWVEDSAAWDEKVTACSICDVRQ